MQAKTMEIIREELSKRGIGVERILLFGSRARGDYREDSDWDLFVVIDTSLSFSEKWDIIDTIKVRLAKAGIPNDIILKSKEEVEEDKQDVGKLTYYVLKEGIEV